MLEGKQAGGCESDWYIWQTNIVQTKLEGIQLGKVIFVRWIVIGPKWDHPRTTSILMMGYISIQLIWIHKTIGKNNNIGSGLLKRKVTYRLLGILDRTILCLLYTTRWV